MGAPKHDVFQAIDDPTRRKLLRLLADQEMPVTVISRYFPGDGRNECGSGFNRHNEYLAPSSFDYEV
jgi:hypothetical protein